LASRLDGAIEWEGCPVIVFWLDVYPAPRTAKFEDSEMLASNAKQ